MVDETKPDRLPPTPHPRFRRRQILTQVLIAAVILVSGMGIGTGGTMLVLKDRIIWHPRRFDPPLPPDIVRMWQADYGLNDDQVRLAKEAFTKSMETTRSFFRDLQTKEQNERQNFVATMKTILTPEQFAKFKSDIDQRAKHFQRMRPGWHPGWRQGGPGGPPGERDGSRKERRSFRGNRNFPPPPGREPPPEEKGFPAGPNLPSGRESGPNAPGGLEPGPKPE